MQQPNLANKLSEELDRINRLALKEAARQKRRARLPAFLRRRGQPVAFTAEPSQARRSRRTDLTVAALGITLGLICALFPWYIFFNPDQFGPPAVQFGGTEGIEATGPVTLAPRGERVGAASEARAIPLDKLDLLATGTTPAVVEGEADHDGDVAVVEQPFPATPIPFKLVHIANGRAMIEDDSGLFIVQRGSVLPDNSHVVSIEQRDGRWVLVTSADEVLVPTE